MSFTATATRFLRAVHIAHTEKGNKRTHAGARDKTRLFAKLRVTSRDVTLVPLLFRVFSFLFFFIYRTFCARFVRYEPAAIGVAVPPRVLARQNVIAIAAILVKTNRIIPPRGAVSLSLSLSLVINELVIISDVM